jgi:hypothetical protein
MGVKNMHNTTQKKLSPENIIKNETRHHVIGVTKMSQGGVVRLLSFLSHPEEYV